MLKKAGILCSLVVLMAMPALAAKAPEHPADAKISEGDAGGWPHVAEIQIKHRLPPVARPNVGEGEELVIEQNWGGCQGNSVCGLTWGACYTRMYATCQDRLEGSGDPCQAC
jgi:hypothetical protein